MATPEPAAPAPRVQTPEPSTPPAPAEPSAAPTAIRITPEHEAEIDRIVEGALAAGAAPGCVVVLGRADGVVFRRAYGLRALEPEPEPMSLDTVFDLASLTKAVATTSAVMVLREQGRIDLDAPAFRYLPGLRGGGREAITVRHLLTHTSGLPPVDPLAAYRGEDRAASLARIFQTPLQAPPGTRARYSDLGFIVLGALVEQVSGVGLDAFVREHVFAPLGMDDTRFTPPPALHPRIAPTERAPRRGDVVIRGVVHDPRAYRLGGVAGNAGLFASPGDLARFARMLLGEGALDGARLFQPETIRALRARQPSTARALGWDMDHATLGPGAFGHGGFTGTSLWLEPERDLFVLLLSNRVHPSGRGNVQSLVRELGAIAREAVPSAAPPAQGAVLTGIDVLRRDDFAPLAGARIVLLTHDAARARDGMRTLDLFASAPALTLVRALSPEHGLGGRHEGRVADDRDARTGVVVHSLFGRTRTPTDAMLEGADTLVVDLVDVGARFYTYAATLRRAMEAAHARGMRVVVLDRPNPLGGHPPRGIVSTEAVRSFVNHHPLPTLHGMTLGELASLLDAERDLGARPTIVRLEGWTRGMPFEATGLRWVPPSPNLRTPEQARLYPMLGLLEGTNLSVGRGTDAPFQLLGAPWMNAEAMRDALGPIAGLRVELATFTPRSARHRRARCRGLRFTLVDPARFEPVRAALTIARALLREHPGDWDADAMLPLLGDPAIHRALLEGADVDVLFARAQPALAAFIERRRPHLLYE